MINSKFNRTKIIATIGPATNSSEALQKIINAGVDVCRLNFSHGTHEEHLDVIKKVRKINSVYGLPICLLADLQGPKIRIGTVKDNEQFLVQGNTLILTTDEVEGTAEKITINYKDFPRDIKPGARVLLDDGKLELEVLETNGKNEVKTKVIYGGKVSSKKGVNLPNTKISLPSLTEKDLRDLDFALEHDAEWIALSFVRDVQDIRHLKKEILAKGKSPKIIAKIEKPEALENIDAIIEEADGIMIARGDLGVEVPLEDLPIIQKSIVNKSIAMAKPVIIATQIMESMIHNPRPTRAETNDVANAVMDGADALMLSGETSVGGYPEEVIQHMKRIIQRVEIENTIYVKRHPINQNSVTFISDAICYNSVLISEELDAKAIIGMTKSGYTAFKISSFRPRARTIVFSSNIPLLNTLSLVWGVEGYYYNKFVSTDETFNDVQEIIKKKGLVEPGDIVINLASMPIHEKKRTNAIKVSRVE
ncbi:MAG: pyruvate kinase [Bacteroidia bacterium]